MPRRGRFPRSAKAYLDDWCGPEAGWLRKYYPPGSDDAHVDSTPALEKAVAFVRSLPQRSFVGTESRLNTAFELLRQIVFGAEADRDVRLAELLRRRSELDAEIAAVQRGDVTLMDPAALRDRYQQFVDTAFGLLSDLRQVEDNFRTLDRGLRERVAGWDGSKGDLLDEVLGDRVTISDSDQGRSFHAFYDFLLSHARQQEFTGLLQRVCELDAIDQVDPRVRRVHHDWLDAGERTQASSSARPCSRAERSSSSSRLTWARCCNARRTCEARRVVSTYVCANSASTSTSASAASGAVVSRASGGRGE